MSTIWDVIKFTIEFAWEYLKVIFKFIKIIDIEQNFAFKIIHLIIGIITIGIQYIFKKIIKFLFNK